MTPPRYFVAVLGAEGFGQDPHGFHPITASTESLLAEYASIDLKRIEEEKRAMLAMIDALRKEAP